MTGRTWLSDAAARLSAAGATDAALDAKWMLADALGVGLGRLPFELDRALTGAQEAQLARWLARRLSGRPLQYAQNRACFMGRDFFVDERVLIPRPDTELLCETGMRFAGARAISALELCTGSGAVAVSLAAACPNARVTATDLSEDALCVARRNARAHGVCLEFLSGDFWTPVMGRRFDLILVNPPYLTDEDLGALQPEVQWEPVLALLGGSDGLSFYRRAACVRDYLNPGGLALFEVGAGQALAVRTLLRTERVLRDLAGIERVVAVARDA